MSKNKLIDLSNLNTFKSNILNLLSNLTKTPLTTSLAVTQEGVSALDGTIGKVLDDKGSQMSVYKGDDGNLHFRDWTGADTVIPFKNSGYEYSGDVTQSLRLSGYVSTYNIIAPTADVVWSLYGGGCYIALNEVTMGSTGSASSSTKTGSFVAKQGDVIKGVAQYPSGSYMRITEHFG